MKVELEMAKYLDDRGGKKLKGEPSHRNQRPHEPAGYVLSLAGKRRWTAGQGSIRPYLKAHKD